MNDLAFRNRVKVACLKYADSILGEPPNTPGHAARYQWATIAQRQPDSTAVTITPPTVMDAAVQEAGAEISDELLQGAVESVINKRI
jgi:hypothetical protein